MSNTESLRDAGTCLGGVLGMFFGSMLGFAFCMQFAFERVAREDGTVHSNQALAPLLGVLAGGCAGAVAGAGLARVLFAVFAFAFATRPEKADAPKDGKGRSG